MCLLLRDEMFNGRYMCCQGYHGVFCGACDDTHGKAKSGSCVDCSPKWTHVAMATFLTLWSTAVIAFVLRRALSSAWRDDLGWKDEETTSCSSFLPADQGAYSESNVPGENKEFHMKSKGAVSCTKKVQTSKSARGTVQISAEVASSLTKKSYVSEIGKVSNKILDSLYVHVHILLWFKCNVVCGSVI